MTPELQTLKNHALNPIFEKSKFKSFLDERTYKANVARLFFINGAANTLEQTLRTLTKQTK